MFMPETTKMRSTLAAAVAVAAIALGGCADMTRSDSDALARERAAEIESQRAELARQKEALDRERAQFEAEKRAEAERDASQADTGEAETLAAAAAGDDRPMDAKPGECYARVIIPAVYETTNERVLTREASQKLEFTPARYETVEEQVEIKPATTKLVVVPAVYEKVQEQILVKPAVTETREVPAVFETVTETRMVEPRRTEWKLGSEIEAGGSVALASASQTVERFSDYNVLDTRVESTGELMCLVEIPARYETIEKQVMVKPPTTITVEIEPPVYKTVEKTVLVTPETTREEIIQAQYQTVSVTKRVEDEQKRVIDVPAQYTTVTSSKRISDEHFSWRPVLCKVNMTRENVSALQTALNETGCCRCGSGRNACNADGIMGPCTLEAARCFAMREKLPWGSNFITLDVVNRLGLKF